MPMYVFCGIINKIDYSSKDGWHLVNLPTIFCYDDMQF